MTCQCLTWCRVPDAESNTMGGKIPMSDHHPNCPEYRDQEYVILEYDGSFVVGEPAMAQEYIDDADDPSNHGYKITRVRLAPDQLEKLPEFDGF